MASEPINVGDNDEVSVKELIVNIQHWIHYLWSKWLILFIVGIVGGVLGLCYAIIKPPVYIATTTFVLEGNDTKGGLGRLAGVAAMAGIDLGGDAGGLFQGDNILELYRSRRMLVQALLSKVHPDSNELLVERYMAYSNTKEHWKDRPQLLALDFRQDSSDLPPDNRRLRDSVLTAFTNTIRLEVLKVERLNKDLSIIRVDVASPSEVFSKTFNENLVREVNKFYVQTKTKKSADNIAVLQRKVDSVRAVMEEAIFSVAKVSDATPNLNPTRQSRRIVPTQEAQFSVETNKTMLSQLLQNLELSKMNLLLEQPLIQLVDQPVYPLKVERVGKVKGILIGGLSLGFLAILLLFAKRWYHDLMSHDNGIGKKNKSSI